jgi:putative ABC transport system ATP-binding protein
MPAIEINDLQFNWPDSDGHGLHIPQLSIASGERLFILGTSGSGKSTLLNLIAGIITPQKGSIRVLGNELHLLGGRARDRVRAAHIGLVFQQFNLIPWLDVASNIRLACSFAGNRDAGSRHRLVELLESLRLDPVLLGRRADMLSVGQQQRVAIARALVNTPGILIADEPTSALDSRARDSFVNLLLQVQAERNITILFVSHDATLAQHFSRVLDMETLNEAGKTHESA